MIISVFMKESRYRKIKNKKLLIILFIIFIIIFIDQIIKLVILNKMYNSSIVIFKGVLNLTYVENTGGAYGIGSNNTIMLIIANIIIIGLLISFILSKKYEKNIKTSIAIALAISGGIGNLIDRIFRGYVIDYIDIGQLIKYPVFNLADICIVIGCVAVVINLIINIKNKT